ncbi:MAG: GNAT family N-acetyltransferase [Oscillospiraceae bacterium]|nr:GNAT family N-acetyltransferase [Oscillospiraceae bacterium]
MQNDTITKLKPEDYHKCSNIWSMEKKPELAQYFYKDMISGNRAIYVYAVNGEYLAEGSLVFERNDPEYSIPGQRIYFSRLVVKEEYRGQGIGSVMIDFIVKQAAEMGYREISIGVDKKNTGALRLYQKKGFNEIVFDGEDEDGPYYKLLKRIDDTHGE